MQSPWAYDPLTRLKTMGFVPDLSWQICALTEEVTDRSGLRFVPTQVQEPLRQYDLVFVPGGLGSRDLLDDAAFIEWLRGAAPCRLKASVCTGSLLLGAAGLLDCSDYFQFLWIFDPDGNKIEFVRLVQDRLR